VDLVEVDRVDAEALEAGLRLAQDRVGLEAVLHASSRPLDQRALREDVWPVGHPGDRAADHRLRAPEAVGRGGVDPVHAEIDRALDGRDRLFVVLRSPPELPAAATDRPRA
jgi:hypothetical protein